MAVMYRGLLAITALVAFVASAGAAEIGPWSVGGHAAATERVDLTAVLKVSTDSLNALRAEADAVSFGGAREGQYLSGAEVAEIVAPSDAELASVKRFFAVRAGCEVVETSAGRDAVYARGCSVSSVNAAFGVVLRMHTHAHSERTILRHVRADADADAPQLPAELAEHVSLVLGLTDLFTSKEEDKGWSRLVARRAAQASGGNAPFLADIAGNETNAALVFEVFCKDGSATSTLAPPCTDHLPAATSWSVVVNETGSPLRTVTVSAEHTTCELQAAEGRRSAVCNTNIAVEPFNPTTFTISTTYSDGSTSESYSYPGPYRPRPLMTPNKMHDLYGVPSKYRHGSASGNSQAIVSFEKQWYLLSDLATFIEQMEIPAVTPTLHGYNNETAGSAGGESTLDVQWVIGSGQNVPTTTWSFPPGDYILNWAINVSATVSAPLVTSISYGDTEVGYQTATGFGRQYIDAFDVQLTKMAARGLTVIAGAGDAGWTNVGEMGNDISKPDPTCGIMRGFYPSSAAYVTSLSSTQVTADGERVISVRDGRAWSTGGGFANFTAVQPWQQEAVGGYLKSAAGSLPPASTFNASGRGYADIATVGDNIACIWNGREIPLGGTSASGPIAAGLVALLNDARLNQGLPSLGHLNPRLYSWAAKDTGAFYDVTEGQNNDGDVQPPGSPFPTFCPHGFPATTGWDAPSGLGTPRMAELFELALAK